MTTYAKTTKVPPSRTRDEITRELKRFGASEFRYYEDEKIATVGFTVETMRVAISLPMTGSWQEVASRWRTLLLAIKAKLALVECGGSTVEREFFADIQLPGGISMIEAVTTYPEVRAKLNSVRSSIKANVIALPPEV